MGSLCARSKSEWLTTREDWKKWLVNLKKKIVLKLKEQQSLLTCVHALLHLPQSQLTLRHHLERSYHDSVMILNDMIWYDVRILPWPPSADEAISVEPFIDFCHGWAKPSASSENSFERKRFPTRNHKAAVIEHQNPLNCYIMGEINLAREWVNPRTRARDRMKECASWQETGKRFGSW